jgi:8-oxo-dGTP diphosphatase
MTAIILTTMCAIADEATDSFLFINRRKSWKGYAFPGGHVEPGESITACVIREVREETGLAATDVKFVGVAHFYNNQTDEKYLVFHYYCSHFTGELLEQTEEGELCWVNRSDMERLPLAEGMDRRLALFLGSGAPTELFVEWNKAGFEAVEQYTL